MLTKPCGRPGCPTPIVVRAQYILNRRTYCSNSCAVQTRIANGWKPHAHLTDEASARGRATGVPKSNRRRHLTALQRAVTECEDLIPAEDRIELSARQLALFRVIAGKAYLRGHANGARKTDTDRRRKVQAA